MIQWLFSWQALGDIFWALLLFILLYFFWERRKVSQRAKHWAQTQGQIEELNWDKEAKESWIQVRYSYQVLAQKLEGNCLFLDSLNNNPNSAYSRKIAYRIAMAFKNDASIEVFYNPDNPAESALDVHVPGKLNIILLLLALMLLLHLGMRLLS